MTNERTILGIDIGGTKLAAGVVSLPGRALLSHQQTPTPAAAGANVVYDTIVSMCRGLSGIERIVAIGVSFGGPVRNQHILHSNHVKGWEGFPLAERLSTDLAPVPIRIANDAKAIGLLEWSERPSLESMLYLTVSTGIGGAFIVDGGPLDGRNGLNGEIGHITLKPDGPICSCGRRGCLEALAAGPAISRMYELRVGKFVSARDIAIHAETGNVDARAVLQTSAHYVGRALTIANTLMDVDCVVVGGGVSRAGGIWWDALQESVETYRLRWHPFPPVEASTYREFEGIWAASNLAADR